ncbi:uncharacterized protein LOC113793754 [Dermatophagoides pteronyssinus]|uniref:uncharacterized protein LOC113793754 n=1 Tax=Dermatophagoides pteronyssinus TaxID=6956 RepID=UPI003F67C5E5
MCVFSLILEIGSKFFENIYIIYSKIIMIKFLLRLPLNRYVITASALGVVGSTICIITLKYSQYSVLRKPFCAMAIEEINRNEAALRLVGEPVKIQPPDLVDKQRNRVGQDQADFWLPFQGSKRNGLLHIEADRIEQKNQDNNGNDNDNGWQLKRIEMKLNDMPDKLLIVYKQKNDQIRN